MELSAELRRQVEHVRQDLRREFAPLPPQVVDQQVQRAQQSLEGARIQQYLPVLVRRQARDHLRKVSGR